jgi:lipid A 3-O-deacylase
MLAKQGRGQCWLIASLLSILPILTSAGGLTPTAVFTQAGAGDESTRAYVFGATWDGPWARQFEHLLLDEYFEVDIGRWSTRADAVTTTAWPTQFGLIPVLRLQQSAESRWFGELGVGPNYIVPLFRSGRKRFSTEFNFGSHVGMGYRFGAARRIEFSVRSEHFSNAGIRHPNPGENFAQGRLAVRF